MSQPPNDAHQLTGDTDGARRDAAEKYVRELRVFYVHAAVAAAACTLIFIVNVVTNASAGTLGDWSTWWSVWAFIGWAPGLAVHGLVVRLNRPKLAESAWEQRQIDNLLKR